MVPGCTRIGSSMPLASAMWRQRCAAPYSRAAITSSVSRCWTTCRLCPAAPPEVGFWAGNLPGSLACFRETSTLALVGVPSSLNIVKLVLMEVTTASNDHALPHSNMQRGGRPLFVFESMLPLFTIARSQRALVYLLRTSSPVSLVSKNSFSERVAASPPVNSSVGTFAPRSAEPDQLTDLAKVYSVGLNMQVTLLPVSRFRRVAFTRGMRAPYTSFVGRGS